MLAQTNDEVDEGGATVEGVILTGIQKSSGKYGRTSSTARTNGCGAEDAFGGMRFNSGWRCTR